MVELDVVDVEQGEVEEEAAPSARYVLIGGRECDLLYRATDESAYWPGVLAYARLRSAGFVEATNGCILTRVPVTVLDGDGEVVHTEDISGGWLINRHQLKVPKMKEGLRLDLETGELAVVDDAWKLVSVLADWAEEDLGSGTYPDTDRVWPKPEIRGETVKFSISETYLDHLARAAKGREGLIFEVETGKPNLPIVWHSRQSNDDLRGLVMPLRIVD